MFAGTDLQDGQPPVLASEKLPIGVLVRLSRRTSTSPLTPPAAPLATLALNCVAAVEPKVTPLYSAQSPFASEPMSWPPPVSVVVSAIVPDWLSYDSAWIVPYASRLPDGGGVVPLPLA